MRTSLIGSLAEKKVADYLKTNGFKILELNWKTPYAEIDIVAQKRRTVYFVEVKYRSSDNAGGGFDYVTAGKLKHMQKAAEAWQLINNWSGESILMAAAVTGKTSEIDLREIT